jgi:aminodeoxychorismate synthase component I
LELFSLQLRGWVNPADTFLQFFANETNSFWLDREHHKTSAFSVVGAGIPAEGLNLETFQDKELSFDWRPGLVGFFEYEGAPKFLNVDRAMVFDHAARKVHLVGIFDSEKSFQDWCNAVFLRLGLIGGELASYRLANSSSSSSKSVKLRHDAQSYLKMIEAAQRHIAAGDVYQICLTNEIVIEHELDPLAVFLNLREINPAPYSAYIRMGDVAVVSSSPEQFLQVSSAGLVSTKPIKGTRPRNSDPVQDAANADELKNNEKERAENLMIVDLMRNDIGKVAKADSVKVPKLFEVETYATVHQLVSTVEAQLAPGESAFTAMNAAFPGGSMTGAPKARAMQIIEELEKGNRGIYSGAIGFFAFNGAADFGMTIRTVVFEGGLASIGVGGGITSDSDPIAELEETKLKAQALLRVLNAPDPWA